MTNVLSLSFRQTVSTGDDVYINPYVCERGNKMCSHLPRSEKHSGQAELVVILIQAQGFEESLKAHREHNIICKDYKCTCVAWGTRILMVNILLLCDVFYLYIVFRLNYQFHSH